MTATTTALDPLTATARRALIQFGVDPSARVEFVNRRENVVFRVSSSDDEWALKVHRPGYHTDSEIESESALLECLSDSGVSVPVPVRRQDGSHIAHVPDDAGNGVQATMQRWLAAAAPLGSSPQTFTGLARPSTDRLVGFGTVIAQLHNCSEHSGTPAGYDREAWDAEGLCGPQALWGRASRLDHLAARDRTLIEETEQRLSENLANLSRTTASYGPIHGDLTLENVLVSDHGFSMIDFDDCGEGWYLFDLATACFFLTGHPDADEMIASVLHGYQSVRPLTPNDRRAWHPLLLARALSYLAWSVDRPEEEATGFHIEKVLPHIISASRSYLATGRTGWPSLPAN